MKHVLLTITMAILPSLTIWQQPARSAEFSTDLAEAMSDDVQVSEAAIGRLRAGGKPMFERLLAYREQADDSELDRVIDRVGGARSSSVSGLYWHTDLEKAKAEARSANKPILSLRMMGKLTDEYSCANSRFFRTTLYANKEISEYLKDHYVLHWKSVRPVPKVTIDFGDGRKLERTLTGNSIHYVLTSDGQVIDGLPGLYSPKRFLAWVKTLEPTAKIFNQTSNLEGVAGNLKTWHTQRANAIARQWQSDLAQVEKTDPEAVKSGNEAKGGNNIPAGVAAALAVGKGALEIPIIANVVRDVRALEAQSIDRTWIEIANLHREEVKLDQASIGLIQSENPSVASSEKAAGDSLKRIVDAFERNIAIDTFKNEYLLHSKLHAWFAEGKAPKDLEELNEKVYAELFLTPREDPWIGLVPPDVYTGLTNGGVVAPE